MVSQATSKRQNLSFEQIKATFPNLLHNVNIQALKKSCTPSWCACSLILFFFVRMLQRPKSSVPELNSITNYTEYHYQFATR